jgi:NitT/TauT family transport system permease protein
MSASATSRRNGAGAWQGWAALAALAAALAWPLAGRTAQQPLYFLSGGEGAALAALLIAVAACAGMVAFRSAVGNVVLLIGSVIATAYVIALLPAIIALEAAAKPTMSALIAATSGFWALVAVAWLLSWLLVRRLCEVHVGTPTGRFLLNIGIPLIFGVWIILLWEVIVRGFSVPAIILPPPSAIWAKLITSVPTLWADFRQTFLKSVLAGYAIGCGSGFLVAIAADRVPFLKRGLLPVGNLVSALPLVAIAPIMVMWFGFDWQSKAAVVVAMTFFPMLINTLAGLAASDAIERDLMHTYAASYWQSLFKLRLPAALPFIFNALKINSTLAMIGAIVAEFFGTPIVGMGFRISTEVGRMNTDMVWAEIAVAALAGSVFYGVVALIERAATFWHPSFRQP